MIKSLLKRTLRPVYYYIKIKSIKDPCEREFQKLYIKYGRTERYKKVDNVKFLSYTLDVPDMQSFIWQIYDIFLYETYKFEADTETPVIFDCGANIGISCLYFKQLYPKSKIKAFEADPVIADILKWNLIRNGIDDVEVINKAVWIDDRGIEFGVEGADGGSIYLKKNRIKVETVRLKDLLEKEEKIDLLKIDIEGAELEVLMDCKKSLTNVQRIFIEYHSWSESDQKLSKVLEVLETNSFRYYIEGIRKRKHPFIIKRDENMDKGQNMDLQLNIWGYRIKHSKLS